MPPEQDGIGTDIHPAKQPADPDAAGPAEGRGPVTKRAVSRLSRKAARRRSRRFRWPTGLPGDGNGPGQRCGVQPVAVAQPGVDVLVALGDPLDGEQADALEFVSAAGPCVVGQFVARPAVPEHVPGHFRAAEELAQREQDRDGDGGQVQQPAVAPEPDGEADVATAARASLIALGRSRRGSSSWIEGVRPEDAWSVL